MNRKDFIKTLALMPFAGAIMNISKLSALGNSLENTREMPVLFVGHGSPMNAIEVNEFSRTWQELGKSLPKPQAILCISAHWETKGTLITAMPKPKTIHDFGGFPKALFDTQYPAPGHPELASETAKSIKGATVGLDEKWGLDHGCWSILKPMFPEADIPVLQMSLDYTKSPRYHYELAKELSFLRKKGVLIIGSGNIVHNLRMIAWDKISEPEYGYDWALKANNDFKVFIKENNYEKLISYKSLGKEAELSIPTPDHYLPVLYSMALKGEKDKLSLFNDKTVMGSISMTSFMIDQI